MTDQHIRAFKDSYVMALESAGARPSLASVNDLLSTAEGLPASPYAFAALAIEYFCLEDGAYNRNQIGLSAVLRFLARISGTPTSHTAVRDLKTILDAGGVTRVSIEGWARSHYSN